MKYILKNTSTTEKTMVNKCFLKTNFGRIYVNSHIKDYELLSPNELRIGTTIINLPQQTMYNKITYIHSQLRDFNVGMLLRYFKTSDYFLENLINENINCPFEEIPFLNNILLSDTDKHSLLKPVYHRYISTKKNNPLYLQKVLKKLKARKNIISDAIYYDKMVLYDVPCIIENSKLRILDRFKIDISESAVIRDEASRKYFSYGFNCISLGVSKFDRVEIIFEEVNSNINPDNVLYEKQIKEIIFIKS